MRGAFASTTTLPIAGKPDDHVRRQTPVLGRFRHLFEEIAVAEHSSHLDRAPKLHLSPVAAHVRGSQRLHETAGLIAKLLVDAAQLGDLRLDFGVGFDPFGFEIGDFRVEALQRFVERRNQVLDCDLSLVELRRGIDLEILEPLFGPLQELLGIRAQCRSGQGAEGVFQNFLGFAVCHVPALRDREAPLRLAQFVSKGPRLLLSRRLPAGRADGAAEEKGEDRNNEGRRLR